MITKSKEFALQIIKVCNYVKQTKKESVLTNQLIRSGTSVGANIREIYLPKGTWVDYFTKEKIESTGMWISKKVDLKTMPIFVKEGTTLKYCEVKESLCNGMGEIVRTEEY